MSGEGQSGTIQRRRRMWKPEQRRTLRKSPRFTPETLARIAENARILDARVRTLRDDLVALARAGKTVKVQPAIDAHGWPNEASITGRFGELYGSTPKAYAHAFKACASCGQLDFREGCAGCLERVRIGGAHFLDLSGLFQCDRCPRIAVQHAEGNDDAMPLACDECWGKANPAKEGAGR